MDFETAKLITGGLSEPSKMPCHAFSIAAKHCKLGNILRQTEGTICNKCYGFKGNYTWPAVTNCLERRFHGLSHPQWTEAMVVMIKTLEFSGYFRWFDCGNIQSVEMLNNIVNIAKALPKIKFWLPTNELGMVAEWLTANGQFPKNLIVRISNVRIDGKPHEMVEKLDLCSSGVTSGEDYTCPAPKRGGKCHDCRKCWKAHVKHVTFKLH